MKNMFKRIIVGVSIALILGFINSCEVNAKSLDSFNLTTLQYMGNSGSKVVNISVGSRFYNYGDGKIIFNFHVPNGPTYGYNEIIQARVYTGTGFNSVCELTESYQIAYQNSLAGGGSEPYFGGIIYNALCDVSLVNTPFTQITLEFREPLSSSAVPVVIMGSVVTFVTDTDNNGVIQAIINYSSLNNTSQILSQLQSYQLQTGTQIQSILDLINNQNTTQSQILQQAKETNDFLKDTSSPSTSDMDFSGSNASNGVISDLVTMPIRLVQSFLNGFNSSCTPFNLGNLLGTDLVLPCINIGSKLGAVWTIIDTIISGLFIYVFGKSCVKKFNDITNMKENQIDEVFD